MTPLPQPDREPPAFNAPTSVLLLIGALVAAHLARLAAPAEMQLDITLLTALFPARYTASPDGVYLIFPGGWPADLWSLFTYTFLHANWMHLGFNAVWLLAFGTPVARRIGAVRFFLFYFLCGVIGAITHVLTHAGEIVPTVGASAAVSGLMGGAARFVFLDGGPLGRLGRSFYGEVGRAEAPRAEASLRQALTDPRVLIFVGVWVGLNILFGAAGLTVTGDMVSIAWEAHLGGFFAGLLAFGLFDPIRRSPSGGPGNVAYGEWGGRRKR